MVELWRNGTIRAAGVSNYAISDLEEIEASGMPLPALNQVRPSARTGVHECQHAGRRACVCALWAVG